MPHHKNLPRMKENIIKASGIAFLVIMLSTGCNKNYLEKPQ